MFVEVTAFRVRRRSSLPALLQCSFPAAWRVVVETTIGGPRVLLPRLLRHFPATHSSKLKHELIIATANPDCNRANLVSPSSRCAIPISSPPQQAKLACLHFSFSLSFSHRSLSPSLALYLYFFSHWFGREWPDFSSFYCVYFFLANETVLRGTVPTALSLWNSQSITELTENPYTHAFAVLYLSRFVWKWFQQTICFLFVSLPKCVTIYKHPMFHQV